jgi:hypothetical protein
MGYDAGKQVKGRKIRALVDTEGLPKVLASLPSLMSCAQLEVAVIFRRTLTRIVRWAVGRGSADAD